MVEMAIVPVIIDSQDGRGNNKRSAWDNDFDQSQYRQGNELRENNGGAVMMRLSDIEQHLILHLRMLERGVYNLEIRRDSSSMWGLREYKIEKDIDH